MLERIFIKDNQDPEEKENISEEELILKKEKALKSINRKQKIKRTFLVIVLVLGLLGGYKSLFSTPENADIEQTEEVAFAKDYLKQYYTFPLSDENKEFLDLYTLDQSSLNHANAIESTRITDIEVYKIEELDSIKGICQYYLKSNYMIKEKDKEPVYQLLYSRVTIAKKDRSYIVIKPITNVLANVPTIEDADVLSSFKYEPKKGNTQVSEEVKEDVSNTISLFLKTYNTDIVQARLLVTEAYNLEELDQGVQLELENVNGVTSDDKTYYVECAIKYSYGEHITTSKKYHIELDIEKNKIQEMEEY